MAPINEPSRGPFESTRSPRGMPAAYIPKFPAVPCLVSAEPYHLSEGFIQSDCSLLTIASIFRHIGAPMLNTHTKYTSAISCSPQNVHTLVPQARAVRVAAITEPTRW